MTKVPLFKSPTHRYTIDGIPTPAVTQVIRGAGLAPPIHVPEHILNAKGAIGTEFHLEISTIAKMIMDFSQADSEERALAIIERKTESESTWRTRAAIKFLCQIQARVIAVEQKVSLGAGIAAGTFDMVVEIEGGGLILIDWKSRKFFVWDFIQLELYRRGFEAQNPNSKIKALCVLPIPSNDKKTAKTPAILTIGSDEHTGVSNTASAALVIYHWRRSNNLLPIETARDNDEQADSIDEDW